MKTRLILFTLFLASGILACSPKSPKLQPPLDTYETVSLDDNEITIQADPQVDIVFVVDTSISMDKHISDLADAVDGFVSAFAKNTLIDYHLGVLSIYDSRSTLQTNAEILNAQAKLPLGELVSLKDAKGMAISGPRYVTRTTPNKIKVLKNTIKMSTIKGFELEESFSPVLSLLGPKVNDEVNKGFYRPSAYLAIIFLTDGEDLTPDEMNAPFSGEKFYYSLVNLKEGMKGKILTYGALVPKKSATCHQDSGGDPNRILDFIFRADGTQFDLCEKGFGKKLAEFGDLLSQRVGQKATKLPALPEAGTIVVTYGSQTIPEERDKGWRFDPDANSVELGSQIEVTPEDGAKFKIKARAIKGENLQNGRAKPI